MEEEHPGYAWRVTACWQPGDSASGWPPPEGWLTINDAVAWILWRYPPGAFRWHDACYPGSGEWWHPAAVMEVLEAIVKAGRPLFRSPTDIPKWLLPGFRGAEPIAHFVALSGERLEGVPAHWRLMAQKLLLGFSAEWRPDSGFAEAYLKVALKPDLLSEAETAEWLNSAGSSGEYARRLQNYEDIWKGAADLRRALGASEVAAFGWPAGVSRETAPRTRIPPDLLASPVCLSPDGVLPCTEEEAWDYARRPSPIWTGVVIDAEQVLRVWPDAATDAGDTPPPPAAGDALANATPSAEMRRRRSARNSLAAADAPLVEEMHALIRAGIARSPWDAALVVCGRAAGGGQTESKAKRLLGRFQNSERFSGERIGKD